MKRALTRLTVVAMSLLASSQGWSHSAPEACAELTQVTPNIFKCITAARATILYNTNDLPVSAPRAPTLVPITPAEFWDLRVATANVQSEINVDAPLRIGAHLTALMKCLDPHLWQKMDSIRGRLFTLQKDEKAAAVYTAAWVEKHHRGAPPEFIQTMRLYEEFLTINDRRPTLDDAPDSLANGERPDPEGALQDEEDLLRFQIAAKQSQAEYHDLETRIAALATTHQCSLEADGSE